MNTASTSSTRCPWTTQTPLHDRGAETVHQKTAGGIAASALCLVACLWTLPQAHAQSTPDNSLLNQRDEEQRQRLRQRMETAPAVQLQQPPQLAAERLPQEDVCRPIHAVRAEPALLRHAQLDEALAGPQGNDAPNGRCIGVAGMKILARRATGALVEQGFLTSRVDVLPQDLRSGTLVLSITPGRIGEIRTESGSTNPWRAVTLAIRPDDVLNLRDIEQSVENLRREGGEVSVQIVPGKSDDTSDIVITQRAGRRVQLALTADDGGTRSTGKQLGNAALSFNNLLGWSELAYLNLGRNLLDRSEEPRGNHSYTLHVDVPVGYWLFGATWGGNANYQTVAGPFQSYRYSGDSQTMEVQLSRMLHRDAAGKTTLSIGGFARRSRSYIEDTEVEVQRRRTGGWELAVSRSQRIFRISAEARLRYRHGTGAFGAMAAPEEALGEGTSRMHVLQASLQLQAPFRLADLPVALSSEWRQQWHRTPLTPQDKMCLGGRYTVRGFDDSQAVCGSSGQLWRNEMSAQLPGLAVLGYGGIDVGRAAAQPEVQQSAQTLVGAFAGLRGALPIGAGQWDLFIGAPLKTPHSNASRRPVAGVQLGATF